MGRIKRFQHVKNAVPIIRTIRPKKPRQPQHSIDGVRVWFSIWMHHPEPGRERRMRKIVIENAILTKGFYQKQTEAENKAQKLANELGKLVYVLRGPFGGGERDQTIAVKKPRRQKKKKGRRLPGHPLPRNRGPIKVQSGFTKNHDYAFTDIMTPKDR